MNLELNDEQSEALIRLLSRTIDDDRYPLSARIGVLKEILRKLQPEPERTAPRPRYGIASRQPRTRIGDEVKDERGCR